jgi:hypothetical protein
MGPTLIAIDLTAACAALSVCSTKRGKAGFRWRLNRLLREARWPDGDRIAVLHERIGTPISVRSPESMLFSANGAGANAPAGTPAAAINQSVVRVICVRK